MEKKPKPPARPKVQHAPLKRKKRRRTRDAERCRKEMSYGVGAAIDYYVCIAEDASNGRKSERFAQAVRTEEVQDGRRDPGLRDLGLRILSPFRDERREQGARTARKRRTKAILAQAARRAGRYGVRADSFDI